MGILGNGIETRLSPTARIATWSARHRWWVIAASALAILMAILVMGTVETKFLEDDGGEGEAAFAADLIDQRFSLDKEPAEQLVFSNPTLDVDAPAFHATVERLVQELRTLPQVESVASFYDTADPNMVSEDRHVLLAQVNVRGDIEPVLDTVDTAAGQAEGFEIAIAGLRSLERQSEEIVAEDFGRILVVSLGLGLIILLLAFRTVVAAIIPLVLAIGAIFSAIGVATLVSQFYPLEELYSEMVLLMGLAVGIDYSLFIVSRFRHERAAGRSKLEAIAVASNTTGRAVFYAGITVVLSLAGLVLTDNPIFISLALGAIIVVLVAIIGSLTLLPALLAALGDNVNRLRIPFLGRGNNGDGIWGSIAGRVLARPSLFASVTTVALIGLTVPVASLNPGFSTGADAYPDAVKGKRALELLEEHFSIGLTQPAVVVVDAPNVNAPEIQASVARLMAQVEQNPAFIGPFATEANPAGDLLLVRVPIDGDPDGKGAEDAVSLLRNQIIPMAFDHNLTRVYVTGQTAGSMDFTDHMYGVAPYVFGFVLGLAFLILLVMFRSIFIPLKAIALNLLSVGAAYGVLELVFQEGLGQGILGFEATGRIMPWLPLFLFAILFGLSMDYHMLLLHRIKEAYDQGHKNEESVAMGIRSTAGTITSAAAIMVGVFAAFALGRDLGLKQFGVGLGVAVLLDATIIRTVLLPASMKLLGDLNWYLPRWLGWLPKATLPEGSLVAAQPAIQLQDGRHELVPQRVPVGVDRR